MGMGDRILGRIESSAGAIEKKLGEIVHADTLRQRGAEHEAAGRAKAAGAKVAERVKAAGESVAGKVEETAGVVTGDRPTEARGKVSEAKGTIREKLNQ